MRKAPEARKVADRIRGLVESMMKGEVTFEDIAEDVERLLRRLRGMDSLEYTLTLAEVLIAMDKPMEMVMNPEEVEDEELEEVTGVFEALLEEMARLDRPLTPREKRLAALAHGVLGVVAIRRDYDMRGLVDHLESFLLFAKDIRFRTVSEGNLFVLVVDPLLWIFSELRETEVILPLTKRTKEALDRLQRRFPEDHWSLWVLKVAWYEGRALRHAGLLDKAVQALKRVRPVMEEVLKLKNAEVDPEWVGENVFWTVAVATEETMVYGEQGDERVLSRVETVRSWLEGPAGELLGPDDQAFFSARLQVAWGEFLLTQGKEKEAEEVLEQAARVYRQIDQGEILPSQRLPGFGAEAAHAHGMLVDLKDRQGKKDQAARYARECARLVEEGLEFDFLARNIYGWAYLYRGSYLKSQTPRKALQEVQEGLRKLLPHVVFGRSVNEKVMKELVDLYEDLLKTTRKKAPADLQELLEEYRILWSQGAGQEEEKT